MDFKPGQEIFIKVKINAIISRESGVTLRVVPMDSKLITDWIDVKESDVQSFEDQLKYN